MPIAYRSLIIARRAIRLLAAPALLLTLALGSAASAGASGPIFTPDGVPSAPDEADCGPPSTSIPGPPPNLIVVGQPMKDSWLMCYMKQDIEGQTFSFDRWGEVRKTSFRGYPVECWTPEADPIAGGRQTNGIVAQLYGWNLDHTQHVRFIPITSGAAAFSGSRASDSLRCRRTFKASASSGLGIYGRADRAWYYLPHPARRRLHQQLPAGDPAFRVAPDCQMRSAARIPTNTPSIPAIMLPNR